MSAIGQAAAILRALGGRPEGLRFSEVVAATQLPKSSAHGALRELVRAGLVDEHDRRYKVGMRLVEIAAARINDTDVTRAFTELTTVRPGALLDETVVLSALEGANVVYLACRTGSRPVAVQYRIGMQLPAAMTASGRAVLATRGDDEVRTILESAGTAPAAVERCLAELASARRVGYAIDDEETTRGMLCFGAAIALGDGEPPRCAIAVSLVKAVAEERPGYPAVYGDEVLRLARAISYQCGGTPPVLSDGDRQSDRGELDMTDQGAVPLVSSAPRRRAKRPDGAGGDHAADGHVEVPA